MDSAQQILLQSLDDTYVALKAEYDALKAVSDSAYEAKTKADKAYETAVDSYNYAALTKNAAYVSKDTTLNDYAIAEDNAYASYVNAQKSYDSANESLQNTLTSNKNSVNSAKISSDTSVSELELIQLQEDLAATEIKAPVDGIVTAVYAKVGSSGSGLLFVIEDTKNLVVDTTIKEYDIETVKTGMEVEIKSDATGEAIYKGVIETIAPTSNKTSQGETDKSGDIVFASKVSVLDSETKLRIGMNVRLNYIVNKKEDTLSVPYEAVFDQDETSGYLLKLEKDGNSYSIRKVSVRIELENDIAIAVSGADLNEGDMIINIPQDYEALVNQKINVNLSTTDKEATNVSSSWKGTK
ncbi:MAG: HlyD family efflux transporter periplasmic adaptor subunit [Clostridiales bacterium]|nr:HlyD family efflux transporter periplasmic adaptor subunit [Clostridiales bacterium]